MMEFNYAEVCMGAQDRGKTYNMKRLDTARAQGKRDVYLSMFRFTEGVQQYIKENGSIKGYEEMVFSEWLYIDIDNDELEQARRATVSTIQNMEAEGIDLDTCRFMFSGSKGFHIYIPSFYFQAYPSVDLPKRFRRMAEYLSPGCDSAIYNTTRIFRLENTINTKSGLYKVELHPSEIINGTADSIREIAKNPREQLEIDEYVEPIETLKDMYNAEFTVKRPTMAGETTTTAYKPCLAAMMGQSACDERNNTAVRITTHFKETGLTMQMAWSSINDWNNALNGPLDDKELETVFQSTWHGSYSFGCNDPLKRANCSATCVFYKDEYKNEMGRGK